ncbi:hypothetical protein M2444_004734 [Paenibacillus sp. PastF-3]|nr:hypothetical protein [Paenibacillus sp. PastF-3]
MKSDTFVEYAMKRIFGKSVFVFTYKTIFRKESYGEI